MDGKIPSIAPYRLPSHFFGPLYETQQIPQNKVVKTSFSLFFGMNAKTDVGFDPPRMQEREVG